MLKGFFQNLRDYTSKRGYVCDACRSEIFSYPQQRLCEDCKRTLNRNQSPFCPKCGRKGVAEGVCMTCKSVVPAFTFGISPFIYRGETAELVNRIKNGERRLAYFFGEEMTDCFLCRFSNIKEEFDEDRYASNKENSTHKLLLLPVPLTKEREKERGYNQSEELSRVVAKRLAEKGVLVEMDMQTLVKCRETRQQKHLGIVQRMENASGAYHVHKRAFCKGRTILLIDDIMTTGATGSECAKLLLGAGAKEVYFLVAAALPEKK